MTDRRVLQLIARDMALDAAAVAGVAALRQAGIDTLLIKGPVTAQRLYAGERHGHHYCDVDLLVAPVDFDRAEAALTEQGYHRADEGVRPSERPWREACWHTPGPDHLAIDLHRSLAFVDDPEALWVELWRGRTWMAVAGSPVATPNLVGTALIVALHAARPAKSDQPYRDLARAVEVFDDRVWRATVELAQSVGAAHGVAFGLDSVAGARPLIGRLGLSTDATLALRMSYLGRSKAGQSLAGVMELEGPGVRLRHVAGRIFPSGASMRKNWPTASTGGGGLLRAYVQRWIAIGVSVPRGLVELRNARRTVGTGRHR